MVDNFWPHIECSAMEFLNSSISAGGAGQFPEPNAINDKSRSVLAINNHIPSNHAGGAALIPQAHDVVNNPRPLMEGASMKLHNSSISAGGSGQISEPNTFNDKSWLVPTINIHYFSNHARGAAQIPQEHVMIDKPWPLLKGAGPYSAFDLSLDKHHTLMESEKLAWQLLMDYIDGFIDNKQATWTEKASARASQIKHRRNSLQMPPSRRTTPPAQLAFLVQPFTTMVWRPQGFTEETMILITKAI